MHFHPPQTRQARWGRCVQRSLMMLWCDVQLIEIWLQKNVYPWQKQCFFIFLLFYRFMWGSNRIIYSISIQDVKANICLDVAPNCFTTTGKKTRKRNCTKVGKKKGRRSFKLISLYEGEFCDLISRTFSRGRRIHHRAETIELNISMAELPDQQKSPAPGSHVHRRADTSLASLRCLPAPFRRSKALLSENLCKQSFFFITLITSCSCLAKIVLFNCLISPSHYSVQYFLYRRVGSLRSSASIDPS